MVLGGASAIMIGTILLHRGDIIFFWLRIPITVVHRALALAILFMFVLTVFTLVLSLLDPHPFLALMFEVASALGTTGYSVGNGDVLSLSAT